MIGARILAKNRIAGQAQYKFHKNGQHQEIEAPTLRFKLFSTAVRHSAFSPQTAEMPHSWRLQEVAQ